MIRTCFYIFVSVIAAQHSDAIFQCAADFLTAIINANVNILIIYATTVTAANIGLTFLVAQDIYVCFCQTLKMNKSILDLIIQMISGMSLMFRFNIGLLRFQGKVIYYYSKAGYLVTKYILNDIHYRG